MHRHNVGMSEAGLDPDLTQKPLDLLLTVGPANFQNFQRVDSVSDGMLSLEDCADSSLAQYSNDGVVANRFSHLKAHRNVPKQKSTAVSRARPLAAFVSDPQLRRVVKRQS